MSSPDLMPLRPAHSHLCFQSQLHCAGQARYGTHLPQVLQSVRGWASSSAALTSSELAHQCLRHHGCSIVLPRQSARPTLLSAIAILGAGLALLLSCPPGPTFLAIVSDKGGGEGQHSCTHTTSQQRTSSPTLSLGPAHLHAPHPPLGPALLCCSD